MGRNYVLQNQLDLLNIQRSYVVSGSGYRFSWQATDLARSPHVLLGNGLAGSITKAMTEILRQYYSDECVQTIELQPEEEY